MAKLKILLFAANPERDLQLDEEIRSIEDALHDGRFRDEVELITSLAARRKDLIDKLDWHEPQIVHFCGHGERGGGGAESDSAPGTRDLGVESSGRSDQSDGRILLVDDQGVVSPVGGKALADLFKYCKGNVRLVVLNACWTRPEAEAISSQVDCVIGTNRPIGDVAARIFSSRFYQTLADGRSVQRAFDNARVELGLHGVPDGTVLELIPRAGVDPAGLRLLGGDVPVVKSDEPIVKLDAMRRLSEVVAGLTRAGSARAALGLVSAGFLSAGLWFGYEKLKPVPEPEPPPIGEIVGKNAPPPIPAPEPISASFSENIFPLVAPPKPAAAPSPGEHHGGSTVSARRLWPGGVIPYRLDPPKELGAIGQTVEEAIRHWNEATDRIYFRPVGPGDAYFVEFVKSNACASSVGKTVDAGGQAIFVAEACAFDNLVHELGHCVGLQHQHCRSDRDNYLDVLMQNMAPGTQPNFEKLPRLPEDVAPFDFSSVMLFSRDAFSINGQDTLRIKSEWSSMVGTNWGVPRRAFAGLRGLSRGDVRAVEVLYPKTVDGKKTSVRPDPIPIPNPSPAAATATSIKPWPGGVIPYTVNVDIPAGLRSQVVLAVGRFNNHSAATGVRYRPFQDDDRAWIQIGQGDGCYSFVGKTVETGPQQLVVEPECSVTYILRELAHAAGLSNQCARLDRDKFIAIHFENMTPGVSNNFEKIKTGYESFPFFDHDSLMNYPENVFSTNDKPTIVSLSGAKIRVGDDLSDTDSKVIAKIYKPTTGH